MRGKLQRIVSDSQYAVGKSVCEWPWQSVVVLGDRRVVPCCYDFDAKYVLGDLRESSLAAIFNAEPMRERRRFLRERRASEVRLCKDCPRGL